MSFKWHQALGFAGEDDDIITQMTVKWHENECRFGIDPERVFLLLLAGSTPYRVECEKVGIFYYWRLIREMSLAMDWQFVVQCLIEF